MSREQQLLARLDAIGHSLQKTGCALALLSLGSVGIERDRLDAYSDLDFFAIVRPGHKPAFLRDLGWLHSINPIAYVFQNTDDGCKLLFEDGIFCEFAVFEPDELARVPFAAGHLVWKSPDFDETLTVPAPRLPELHPVEWLVGEALTNLYVGLCRYHRGEKLSAARFIQGYAVDRIVDLSARIEAEQPAYRDLFTAERRYEWRFPGIAARLPEFIQGYANSVESAQAILAFLDAHFDVNPAIKQAILVLCESQT
jgi:hypothetical protein